jgi:hypothetical protein
MTLFHRTHTHIVFVTFRTRFITVVRPAMKMNPSRSRSQWLSYGEEWTDKLTSVRNDACHNQINHFSGVISSGRRFLSYLTCFSLMRRAGETEWEGQTDRWTDGRLALCYKMCSSCAVIRVIIWKNRWTGRAPPRDM